MSCTKKLKRATKRSKQKIYLHSKLRDREKCSATRFLVSNTEMVERGTPTNRVWVSAISTTTITTTTSLADHSHVGIVAISWQCSPSLSCTRRRCRVLLCNFSALENKEIQRFSKYSSGREMWVMHCKSILPQMSLAASYFVYFMIRQCIFVSHCILLALTVIRCNLQASQANLRRLAVTYFQVICLLSFFHPYSNSTWQLARVITRIPRRAHQSTVRCRSPSLSHAPAAHHRCSARMRVRAMLSSQNKSALFVTIFHSQGLFFPVSFQSSFIWIFHSSIVDFNTLLFLLLTSLRSTYLRVCCLFL